MCRVISQVADINTSGGVHNLDNPLAVIDNDYIGYIRYIIKNSQLFAVYDPKWSAKQRIENLPKMNTELSRAQHREAVSFVRKHHRAIYGKTPAKTTVEALKTVRGAYGRSVEHYELANFLNHDIGGNEEVIGKMLELCPHKRVVKLIDEIDDYLLSSEDRESMMEYLDDNYG